MATLTKAMWQKLKSEYISTDISLRKLAKKHGVSAASLNSLSIKEGWVQQKTEYQAKICRKAADKMADHQVERIVYVDRIADKLLAKIEQSVDELEIFTVEKQKERKQYEYDASGNKISEDRVLEKTIEACERKVIDRQGLKAITSALKDIKEIKMIQSALQEQEQKARIEKLRKECETEEQDRTVIVTFQDGDEYGV